MNAGPLRDEQATVVSTEPTDDADVRARQAADMTSPEIGDVADALDDAAASFKAVVADTSTRFIDDVRLAIRENPLLSAVAVAALAYTVGRAGRSS